MKNVLLVLNEVKDKFYDAFSKDIEVQIVYVSNDIKKLMSYVKRSKPIIIIMPLYLQVENDGEKYNVWQIVIWLKISGVHDHIIVYGNERIERLLRCEIYSFIMRALGITYMRAPSIIDASIIKVKHGDKSNKDNLKKVLSMVIDIRNVRHAYANIWGLERIMEVHKKYYEVSDINVCKQNCDFGYLIAKYVFDVYGQEINDEKHPYTQNAIRDINRSLKMNSGLVILVIDDKVDTGWGDIYKSILCKNNDSNSDYRSALLNIKKNICNTSDGILEENKIINMTISNYNDNLMHEYDKLLKEYMKIDVVILDMRLYPKEANVHDYENLKSVKLMKYVFDQASSGKSKYKRTRFMISTASNQLLNYKNIITSKYMPASIFIKEGFDIIASQAQHEENYRNLINCLKSAINQNYTLKDKTPSRIDNSYTDNDAYKLENFEKYLFSAKWYDEGEVLKKLINSYDYVLIDTCIYYDDKEPYIMSYDYGRKVKCFLPVYMEMKRLDETNEASFKRYMASRYVERYSENILDEILTDEDKAQINDEIFNKNRSDVADKYFLPVIKRLKEKNSECKILFITNDYGPRNKVVAWYTAYKKNNIVVFTKSDIKKYMSIKSA